MPDLKGSSVNGHWSLGKREKESSLVQRESTCPECKDEEEEKEKNQIQTKPTGDQITSLVQRQEEPEEKEEEEEPVQAKLNENNQLQRQEEEPEEEEEPVQAKQTSNQTPHIAPGLQNQIQSIQGGGQPLSKAVRNYFEPRFGHDFSQVRVHTDSKAADAAKSVNAKAFTKDRDVVFGTGQYAAETMEGKRLLAHELTHVVQQSIGTGGKAKGSRQDHSQIVQCQGGKKRSKSGSLLTSPMIKQINVNVRTPQTVSVVWDWPGSKRLPKKLARRSQWGGGFLSALGIPGFFTCSTGAGICSKNCNDTKISQEKDTMCTPKGGCWVVEPKWTHRKSPSKLNYFVGFQRQTIGLHSNIHKGKTLTVDGTPHSHGCVRLSHLIAQMIYENIWPGYTKVCVSGNWSGQTCWRGKKEVPRPGLKKKRPRGILI
jgi:hypothetical protein